MFERNRLLKKAQEVKKKHIEFMQPEDAILSGKMDIANRAEVQMYEQLATEHLQSEFFEMLVAKIAQAAIAILSVIGAITLCSSNLRNAFIETIGAFTEFIQNML